jgi:hypothetical protein
MWYYLDAGESRGPLEEGAFRDLISQGFIRPESLVWNEGLLDWVALRELPSSGAAITSADPAAACAICQNRVGADNLIQLNGVPVCAACKPLVVQQMREGVDVGFGSAWQEGKKIIIRDKVRLPARCVKCNAETTDPPLKRKLYWHHPALYLLLFFNALVYIVVAMIVRRRASAEVYLCAQHRTRRRNFMLAGWLGGIFGLVMITVAAAFQIGWLIALSVLVTLAAIVIGIRGGTVVRTARIKKDLVWLTGAGEAFRASLPAWIP